MKYCSILLPLLIGPCLFAQDLFETALSGAPSSDAEERTYELNGYIRGVLYGGRIPETERTEIKSAYGELSLKTKVRLRDFGDGYAEIRYRRGVEFNQYITEAALREAYVAMYLGRFDILAGHQIVVWGRADGFNPTDTISPKNMLVRSPNEDDRREGNFLMRTFFNYRPFRLEAIWIPAYAASVLPLHLVELPEGVNLLEPRYPEFSLKNSGVALRLNIELAAIDGSLSYFNGFNPLPGADMDPQGIVPRAYRMHYWGADFAATIGDVGLRGEVAYRKAHLEYSENSYIPFPDLYYILGGDKTVDNFSIVMQYIGRYVFDYTELFAPSTVLEMISFELASKNRMLASQLDEVSHGFFFRPALQIAHETLILEILGYYNITTEEFLFKPKVSYAVTDALNMICGAEIYGGPENTLFGTVEESLSSLFFELKASF